MLGVLFLGARMRALQLSHQEGSPQCWSHEAMLIASAALLAQVVTVLLASFLCEKASVDGTGLPVFSGMTWGLAWNMVEAFKAVSFIAFCGSVLAVVGSVIA